MVVSGQIHAPVALSLMKRAPGPHCIENWMGPRPDLNTVANRRTPILAGNQMVIEPTAGHFTYRAD
jgi:hypothetical protein